MGWDPIIWQVEGTPAASYLHKSLDRRRGFKAKGCSSRQARQGRAGHRPGTAQARYTLGLLLLSLLLLVFSLSNIALALGSFSLYIARAFLFSVALALALGFLSLSLTLFFFSLLCCVNSGRPFCCSVGALAFCLSVYIEFHRVPPALRCVLACTLPQFVFFSSFSVFIT